MQTYCFLTQHSVLFLYTRAVFQPLEVVAGEDAAQTFPRGGWSLVLFYRGFPKLPVGKGEL